MSLNKAWLVFDSIFALSFGVTMYKITAESRPFRMGPGSTVNTLEAVGVGVVSGLIFLACGALLGVLYANAKPAPDEVSINSILLRVLVAAVIGGAIGATVYVPLLGNMAVVFLDYHGVILYFTGAIGGCIGAIIAAIASTQAMPWWLRIVVVLGAGLVGLVIGFILGSLLIALFTAPFARRTP